MIQDLYHKCAPREMARVAAAPGRSRMSIAFILAAPFIGGTSSSIAASPADFRTNPTQVSVERLAREEEVRVSDTLLEIKTQAGLTWAQLASLFGVWPKSVHNWVGGGGMNAENRHIMNAALDKVRSMAGQRAYKIRDALGIDNSKRKPLVRDDGIGNDVSGASLRHRVSMVENTLEIME